MSIFIIGEIGINHNGDIGIAKDLIDVAADADYRLGECRVSSLDAPATQETPCEPR